MIEKFNLYDVYGYFLPGLALIAEAHYQCVRRTGTSSADRAGVVAEGLEHLVAGRGVREPGLVGEAPETA